MLALGEMSNPLLRAWGQLKRGFEVPTLGETPFLTGMGAVEKGVKCVSRAWGQLKRGFEVLALGERCFEGMGAVEKGV